MRRPRLTLMGLMASVVVLAALFAVVRHASTYWGAGEILTIVIGMLLASALVAWFRGGRRGAFWMGFATTGCAYLILSLSVWSDPPMSSHLPTTKLLDTLHGQVHPEPDRWIDNLGSWDGPLGYPHCLERFRQGGHSLWSLLLALLGGIAARLLFPVRSGKDAPSQRADEAV
jgi:hypothetical protein